MNRLDLQFVRGPSCRCSPSWRCDDGAYDGVWRCAPLVADSADSVRTHRRRPKVSLGIAAACSSRNPCRRCRRKWRTTAHGKRRIAPGPGRVQRWLLLPRRPKRPKSFACPDLQSHACGAAVPMTTTHRRFPDAIGVSSHAHPIAGPGSYCSLVLRCFRCLRRGAADSTTVGFWYQRFSWQ